MKSRRKFLTRSLLTVPAVISLRPAGQSKADSIRTSIADLEETHGGRLGVSLLDVATGHRVDHRADEQFAMCSTFKVLAAGLILTRVDSNKEKLDRQIIFSNDRVVAYSPETKNHTGEPGMTLGEICKAALTLSDNTAANLMLESFGGPAALTRFARSLGDEVTRLDRNETSLNEATPGDPRDTTTPAAMADDLRKIVLADVLTARSRHQLVTWMIANKTGGQRLRASIPPTWRVGDKTGTGDHAATNDVAVIWPPNRTPIIATVYYAKSTAPDDVRNLVLAQVGRLTLKL